MWTRTYTIMSIISRLWNSMRSPVRLIGRDLQGNTYHEAPQPNDPIRPKRFVQYKDKGDEWNHIAGQKRLPVQWSAWLTYTRAHPPTLEELQADVERQQRLLANVARIQARDRAEEEEMLRIRQQDAQQALIDAASVHTRPEAISSSSSVPAPESAPHVLESESEPTSTKAPTVLPPTFLTPSTPRKGKSTGKFRLPSLDWSANDGAAEVPPAPEEKSRIEQKEVPYAPSKPVAETESWTPKAIRRGQ
ncbi:hypothetical protein D9619_007979 [Psilocybe cf. subviscida]|uniref:NADH dehydrogenase [ubiquinone] 1 alpha subcomplex subunit n=1 Tax=Psilocybe cf. subviscida TaxID=2480587 RepID=A0A8H5AUZ0_9AGAR|nr:hypothetical protein D9619_007979 [Psilocybe cf. subviscida]